MRLVVLIVGTMIAFAISGATIASPAEVDFSTFSALAAYAILLDIFKQ